MSVAKGIDQEFVRDMTVTSNGVLIFTGLFAAVVANFLVQTYSLLPTAPEPDQATVVLREMLTIMRSDQSGNDVSSRLIQMDAATTYSPTTYATRLNTVWALSLVLSLFSAFMATLIQTWVRQYLSAIHAAGSLHDRALLHASLLGGVKQFAMRYAVDLVVILLHSAVALFLYGLTIYLEAASHIVARPVKAACILFVIVYMTFTVSPLLFPTSPYSTPVSEPLRLPLSAIVFLARWILWIPILLANHYLGLIQPFAQWKRLSVLLDPLAIAQDRRRRLMTSLRTHSEQRSRVFLQQLSQAFQKSANTRLFFAHIPQEKDSILVEDDQQAYRLMLQAGLHHEVAWFIDSMPHDNSLSTMTEDIRIASTISRHIIEHSTSDDDAILPLFKAWQARTDHPNPDLSLIALCQVADARLRFLKYPSPQATSGSHVKAWWKHTDDVNALSAGSGTEHGQMQGYLFRLESMHFPISLPATPRSTQSPDSAGAPYICRHLSTLAFVSFVASIASTLARGASSAKPISNAVLAACVPTLNALVDRVITDIPSKASYAHYQLRALLKILSANMLSSSAGHSATASTSQKGSQDGSALVERWDELQIALQRVSDALETMVEDGEHLTNTDSTLRPFPDMYNAIGRLRVGSV
ncbi:unnamed protein product [Peniophora sp. CBMAI 1063]|nr:unnamed protein product [Peniophora sp. CBMAI 1063]